MVMGRCIGRMNIIRDNGKEGCNMERESCAEMEC